MKVEKPEKIRFDRDPVLLFAFFASQLPSLGCSPEYQCLQRWQIHLHLAPWSLQAFGLFVLPGNTLRKVKFVGPGVKSSSREVLWDQAKSRHCLSIKLRGRRCVTDCGQPKL